MKFIDPIKISVMLVVILCVFFSGSISGQEVSKAELEARAFQYFETNLYDKATSDFEILYNMFPKDSRYAYYLGRSYFHTNQKLDQAIELLKFAATRNYGTDTYYYLGRTYHLNYIFEDAALSFHTFKKTARNSDIKKYKIDYWLEVNDNAREAVKIAQHIVIDNQKTVPVNAMESAFDKELAGSYIYIPDEFRSLDDKDLNYQSLMYLPQNAEIGDHIYFESKSKKDKHGLDIYRVQILSAENFSIPEPLSDKINTNYNEAYPRYDKETATLYFSSMGHNTSGGYDIFRSSYDSVNATWTEVEKLNFPINTTSDDILFTGLSDPHKYIFLSNRAVGLNEYVAYTMVIGDQASYTTPKNRDEILACAMLSGQEKLDNLNIAYQKYEQGTITQDELSKINNVFNHKAEYETLLTEALILQSQSDSLAWIARDLEVKIDAEEDFQKKQVLIANAATFDQESKRLQKLADEKFLQAEQYTDPIEVEIQPAKTEIIQEENNIDGITVYSYVTETGPEEKEPETEQETDYNKGKEAAKLAQSQFVIQSSSPYSSSNPIPQATMPMGLIYKIQLGSFSKPVPEDTFNGLTPISQEEESGTYKYYVGSFASLKEVRKALEQVRNYGFPDAFIVSFNNNEKINIQKAKEIEFASK